MVESTLVKSEGARSTSEYVTVRVFNKTQRKIQIRKHDILATAELLSKDALNTLEVFTGESNAKLCEFNTKIFIRQCS